MNATNADTTLQRPTLQQEAVMGWNVAFSASACAAGYALVSPGFAAAVALGALLEAANFRTLFRTCERIFFAGAEGINGAGPAIGAFSLRFVLLGVALFFALRAGFSPVGLVLGLSLIMPAVILAAWRARPPIDPDAKALPDDDPSWDAWNPWFAREIHPDEDEDGDDPTGAATPLGLVDSADAHHPEDRS